MTYPNDLDGRSPKKPDEPLPKDDIGPIYKWMAGIAIIVAIGVAALHAWMDHPIGLYDVIWIGVIALLCLALWRPYNFDQAIKTIADRMPSFSYQKKHDGEV